MSKSPEVNSIGGESPGKIMRPGLMKGWQSCDVDIDVADAKWSNNAVHRVRSGSNIDMPGSNTCALENSVVRSGAGC